MNVDHRHLAMIESGALVSYLRDTFDELANLTTYPEAVHRLTDLGAVITHVGAGTSTDGFDAEWRMINVIVLDGDLIRRSEMYDEADLGAALARFDELSRPAPRPENMASQVNQRFLACFAARDWAAIAGLLTEDTATDDRRPLLGVGARCAKDAVIADWRATAEVGVKNISATVIATRGQCLALCRYRFSGHDQRPEAYHTDVLGILEIDTAQRISASVMLDENDIEAAIAELDARYLAGEAAAHPHAWSVVSRAHARYNRRELPLTTRDWVNIDHRRGISFEPGDLISYIRATWEDMPDVHTRIAAVHCLSDHGAVITTATHGTSPEGFDAEWLQADVVTIEGELINRNETFDLEDIDAALARFDELHPKAARLDNAATQTWERLTGAVNRRDMAGFLNSVSADGHFEDRRKGLRDSVVGAHLKNLVYALFETVPSSWNLHVEPVALRGALLSLTREIFRDTADADHPIVVEILRVSEVTADGLLLGTVLFDPDDIHAAIDELDAHYLAGEAAAHAHTWSLVTGAYAALNRRELPATTPTSLNIDHRRGIGAPPGDLLAAVRASWNVTPDICYRIEAVNRMSDRAAVVTHTSKGTAQQGFDAEWRTINVLAVDGELIDGIEVFDEADLDAALTRFGELSAPPAPPAAC